MATTSSITNTASANVKTMVQQLLANDRAPLTRLQNQKSDLQGRIKAFQSLGSRLSSLLGLARGLSTPGGTRGILPATVTNTDLSAAEVTAKAGAVSGDLRLEVRRLALAQTLTSEAVDSASRPAMESLAPDGTLRFGFTSAGKTTEVSVPVAAGATWGDVLDAAARAINASGGPLKASVLVTGNGKERLLLRAARSGEAGGVSALTDLKGTGLSSLGLTATNKNGRLTAVTQEAQNALVLVNGAEVTAESNTIEEVLPGITLNLKAAGKGAQTVGVSIDADAAVKRIQDFIAGYNAAVDEIRSDTRAADEQGSNRGIFTGDVAVGRLRTAIREAITKPSAGSLPTLSRIGIVSDRQGKLSIDDMNALRSAITGDSESVAALLGGTDGVATRLTGILESYSRTGGVLAKQQTAVQTRIRNIDSQIAIQNRNLSRREEALTRQLAGLEASIGSLKAQQQYLGSILSSGDQAALGY